ncbi:NAD+ synthase [Candidatus Bipolaricaulota bacterium]|nr:NAD+ synthase [Candidatus Bipolaricaulota bacterium]
MRIAIGQLNAHVGNVEQNTTKILTWIAEARQSSCDLVIFPELAVCGYSPLDLFWHDGFTASCQAAIDRIVAASAGIGVIVGGLAVRHKQESSNRDNVSSVSDGALIDLYNRAYLIEDGVVLGHVDKQHLPSYDVYCEKRHFTPGEGTSVHAFHGITLGINICEDLWIDDGPTDLQASLGAEWIINLSASPFYEGKPSIRHRLAKRRTKENHVGLVYVNMVGGQDEVVFDGSSFVVDAQSRLIFQAPSFQEGLFVLDLDHAKSVHSNAPVDIAEARKALVLGIRDYLGKNGFKRAILGVSGGIDSAVVAALAVEAMGASHVLCVYMPSEFSSQESLEDAQAVSENLGARFQAIGISDTHAALRGALPDSPTGLVDENLQPRIRGTLLMALANQHHALVLCPGNKSEIAVGYNTLYGDTVGALAPIADLYKDQVYALAASYGDVIPERIRTKPPSAELRPDQRDDDDLPPYDVLDPMLRRILETNASKRQLLEAGFNESMIDDVLHRITRNEHKRHQLPPGLKLSPKAFGSGRKFPLTNGYTE